MTDVRARAAGCVLSRPGVLWLLLCAALALASLLAWAVDSTRLDWQPQRWPQAWRWWSAALVHWTPLHLGANLLATALVAAYGWAARAPRVVALAWAAAWPLTHLALLAKPELLHYGGLSGVLHAGVAATSVWLVRCGRGGQRTVGGLMLAGQGLKLLLEQPWGAALHPPGELDVAVAPLAHASGSIAGALLTLIALHAGDSGSRLVPRARLDSPLPDPPMETPLITLCGFSLSNYYNKVKMVLLEKGIPFTEERVMTKSADEAVLDATPLGKIPFIRTPHGALCESQVIVDYLEAMSPQNPLLPADPWQAAKVRELVTFIELHLELVARELYGQAFFGGTVSDEVRERVRKLLAKNIAGFKRLAKFAPYVAGETFTQADCSAFVSLPLVATASKSVLGEDLLAAAGVDWKSYVKRVGERPSAQRVGADRKADAERLAAETKKA